ncbi:MAG: mechanosensitive ion channel domain-containing protein [Chitinophagaceae bacterium]
MNIHPTGMISYRLLLKKTWLFCLLFMQAGLHAQTRDSVPSPPDTVQQKSVTDRVQTMMKASAAESRDEFLQEKNLLKQRQLIDALEANTVKAKNYLKHQLDTVEISADLLAISKWLDISVDGVSSSQVLYLSYRDLVTTGKLLKELNERIISTKQRLDGYEKALQNFRFVTDSLSADSTIFSLPKDSAQVMEFLQKYAYLAARLQPADSLLTKALSGIHGLQARANFLQYKVNGDLEEIDALQRQTSKTLFLAKSKPENISVIKGSFKRSAEKSTLLLKFYMQHHAGKVILILLLITASTVFLSSLKKIRKAKDLMQPDHKGQLVLRYPFASAIVLVFSIFQFVFPDPPFIINLICWGISAAALAFIFHSFIAKFWFKFWVYIIFLFTAASVCNLSLQYSELEKWVILLLSFLGIVTGVYYFFSKRKQELREKLILTFIALTVLFEACAVLTGLTGYFNLSKAFFVCGYCNILIGVLFLWTIRFINEGLYLAGEVYTKQSPKLFFVNFNKVGTQAPTILYVLLIAGWLILLGRNFYEYQYVAAPLREFFIRERIVGDYTFAINNILVFFGIMALAVIASRITSFFASEKHIGHAGPNKRKAGIGSWLLLIRVGIISSGLFLALAASGFPIDRITILIGALGVGIGLGLQNLVNNLVSGLIIAFDRPVNVGDFVEISGHSGTVKSIGFRSSVLSGSNGADIVIPNGDLLNAHLVNWTLGGNKRQMEVLLGVAYGSDLSLVQNIIADLYKADERILEYPSPGVIFEKFGDSAVNGKALFWVRDYREAAAVKSRLMIDIMNAFDKHGISIPFPQQDIHLYRSDGQALNNNNTEEIR